MNNDYCLQSYRNNYQGEGAGAGGGAGGGAKAGAIATTKAITPNWIQKTRIYKVITNPMFIVCLIIFIGFIVVIYWNYIRPRQFKTIYKKTTTICRVQILSSDKPGTRSYARTGN